MSRHEIAEWMAFVAMLGFLGYIIRTIIEEYNDTN